MYLLFVRNNRNDKKKPIFDSKTSLSSTHLTDFYQQSCQTNPPPSQQTMMYRSFVRRCCASASIGTNNTTRSAYNNITFYYRQQCHARSFTSSTYLYDSSSNNNNDNNNSNIKEQLLNLSLKHVPKYGWNDDAIVAGASEMITIHNNITTTTNTQHDVDGTTTRSNTISNHTSSSTSSSSSLSLAGLINVQDLITHLMNQWNIQFRNELLLLLQQQQQQQQQQKQKQVQKQQQGTSSKINNETSEIIENSSNPEYTNNNNNTVQSIKEQIKYLMKKRLQYPIQYIQCKRWHEGMALGIVPTQIQTTTDQLKDIINIICYHIECTTNNGSNKSNNNTTTTSLSSIEKFILGTIYVTTELHMLQDTSNDYSDTWEFLSNRIDEWDTYRNNTLSLNSSSSSSSSFDINTMLSLLSSFHSNTIGTSNSNHTISSVVPIITSVATGIVSVVVPSASQYVAANIPTTMSTSTTALQDFITRTATGTTTTTTTATTSTTSNNNTNYDYGFTPPTSSSGTGSNNIYEINTVADNDGTDPSHYNVSK